MGEALNHSLHAMSDQIVGRRASRINGQISVPVDVASAFNGLQQHALAYLCFRDNIIPYSGEKRWPRSFGQTSRHLKGKLLAKCPAAHCQTHKECLTRQLGVP
jgi:hypothetical protein